MKTAEDAYFALHGTLNFLGMVVAKQFVRRGDLVYEFGANVGTETLSLAHLAGEHGRIVAVEADAILSSELARRVAQNKLRNVVVVPKALSHETGLVQLHRNIRYPGQTFVQMSVGGGDDFVPATTADDLLRQFGPPSFVCMDIEGSEYACLRGGRALLERARPVIFTEVVGAHMHRAGVSVEKFANLVFRYAYAAFDAQRARFPEIKRGSVTEETYSDWVLLPEERRSAAEGLRRILLRARVMPRVRWLSPLVG